MDVQSAANLNIPEGSVRNIHDKDKRLLWSAVGYNVRYDGDTTQQTYTGKNMLNVPDGSQTSNGITWTRKFGVCHGVGTLTGQTYSNMVGHIDLNLPAGYYTFSIGEALPSTLQIEFSTRDNNETRRNYRISAGATSTTLNFPNGLKWTGISLANGTIGQSVDVTIKNIQVEAGSTATPYEPYVGGSPSPNPDYPQDVNVVQGKQTTLVSGKNLLSVSFAVSGGVPSDIPTNTFVLDRENQRYFRCDFPTLLPPGTYTISFDISNNNTLSGVSFNIFNKSQATIGGAYNLSGSHYSGTFTVTESIQIIRWFIASNESNDKHATISNVQIEAGSTATAYEMYQGQQTFPVDLIGKNLFSGWTIGKKLNGSGVETTDQNGAVSGFIPVASDTNYIFSDLPDGLYTFIAAYNSQKQFLGRTGASGGSSSKGCKTLPSYFSYGTPAGTGDVAYLRVTAYQSGQYADPITVINSLQTQLEVGTSATPYAPYYNYELCKIGNYQDYIFKSSGKNLFDGVLEIGIINGITGLDQANSNFVRAEDYIPVEELTYYRFSTDNANISSVFVYEYKADKTYNLATNKSLTLTNVYRTEEGTAFIRFRPNYQTTDTSIRFQVEKGTVVTPYEPYGTDWYVYEKMGKLVFNGSENWAVSNSGTVNFYYGLTNLNLGFTQNTLALVSNYGSPGEVGNTNTKQGIIIVPAGGNNQLRIRYGTEMTVASWQSKLSTTNMVLYYARKTPTYTKITDTTLIGQLNVIHDWLRRYDYYGVVTGNLPIIINRTGLT